MAGLTAESIAALGDGASHSMRWLNMSLSEPTYSPSDPRPVNLAYALKVVEDPTNNFVRLIKDTLNLISVMGPARSGKSTLMNILAGCTATELFATYPGMETFTKGIQIPTRVLSLPQFSAQEGQSVVDPSTENVKVTFVDTEGQGALGDNYDMDLFSPALVTSRVVIYNRTGGLLTEEILSQLGMMTQAAKRLRAGENARPSESAGSGTAAAGSGTAATGPLFGHLFIIFNQFRTNKVDTVTTLKNALMNLEPETDSNSINRNNIRKLLTSVFESIQVFILPDGLKSQARDDLADGIKPFILLSDFTPRYLEYFKILRDGLSRALVAPRELTPGMPLTGGTIADFMPMFADAINRSQPLNLPSIFELAQNNALNKVQITFTNGLSVISNSVLADPALSTQLLSTKFDSNVTLLLSQLANSISYMPTEAVRRAQNDASSSATAVKVNLIATNLGRIKTLMSTSMTNLIGSIGTELSKVFPTNEILQSPTDINNAFITLFNSLSSNLKNQGDAYDPHALPDNYEASIQSALDLHRSGIESKAASSWGVWATNLSQASIKTLTDNLAALGRNTQVGNSSQYNTSAASLCGTEKSNFNQKLDNEYLWYDKQDKKDLFANSANSAMDTQKALWMKNDEDVKASLNVIFENLKQTYVMQLQNALVPHSEPDLFITISNPTPTKDALRLFCSQQSIAAGLTTKTESDFDVFVADKKSTFVATYNLACDNYRSYISGELSARVPLILQACRNQLDLIDLNLDLPTTTREQITVTSNAAVTDARNKFTLAKGRLNALPNGTISTTTIQTYQLQLDSGLELDRRAKVDKYDEVVSVYNKALLTELVIPIVDQTLANDYTSTEALDTSIARQLALFIARKKGEQALAQQKWDEWKRKTYPALVEVVQRNNSYRVDGLDGNLAATKEIQEHVIKNISPLCSGLASYLGMSWICNGDFNNVKPQDMGMSTKDPTKPALQNSRTMRLTNTPGSGYDGAHSTNLEFFDWVVEVSDIMWGKPIITDLKPLKLDTTEYPAQATPITVTIGSISTVTSTVTDTQSWGVNAGVEVGYKWGVKDSWEANMKATFNGNFSNISVKSEASTYTTSTSAQITLPANRVNCVHQMVFDQRTSLPYTARVKVVPRLRFQNGFTVWGGGGSYASNQNTAARKPAFKGSDRVYCSDAQSTFEFRRTDEIRDDALSNADPWEWTLAMQRNPWIRSTLDRLTEASNYEVFVKGKWEGITGKYAVTTVTPKNTVTTLLPPS
ncbi:hypothetical protein DSL72_008306 [Monilinia vaccinii-corymbosi]|uniref:Guanylate-binding protein N-terminal domain-containing protein n=1 Tax=Monilinia vaccinii-corymbosi TaxID=61207 RepID=A0A8A3PKM1_9HELO|nr:hypothetical protein DSL72_008306 [Monilinia vaccinii-corymbosi]